MGFAGLVNPQNADCLVQQKPVCPECGKTYSSNSNLKQHMANVHAPAVRTQVCTVCCKTFKTKQYLQVHLLASHGIRQRKSYFSSYSPQPDSGSSSTFKQEPMDSFYWGVHSHKTVIVVTRACSVYRRVFIETSTWRKFLVSSEPFHLDIFKACVL